MFLLIMKISYKENEGCFSIISIFIRAGLCWPESPLRCQVPKAVGNSRGRQKTTQATVNSPPVSLSAKAQLQKLLGPYPLCIIHTVKSTSVFQIQTPRGGQFLQIFHFLVKHIHFKFSTIWLSVFTHLSLNWAAIQSKAIQQLSLSIKLLRVRIQIICQWKNSLDQKFVGSQNSESSFSFFFNPPSSSRRSLKTAYHYLLHRLDK